MQDEHKQPVVEILARINGSYPFIHLRGGPFQLFTYVEFFMVRISLIVICIMIKKRRKRGEIL